MEIISKIFPILSVMAKDYLAIQSTSVSYEQASFIASLTIFKLRNWLDPEIICALLCLKSWISEKIGEYNNTNYQSNSENEQEDSD